MPIYQTPLRDIGFVLKDIIEAQQLQSLPGYEEANPELIDTILEECGKLAENELFPLNQSGDQEGCLFQEGVVTTPRGFREAYSIFVENGWGSLSCDPQWGGQGMPKLVNTVMEEILCSANLSFGIYPGLTHGAYNALELYGSEALKKIYLPKLTSGLWSGTMCLTEAHCGTDLGLIKTKADPAPNGSYQITGSKIFISAGEHDLTENIVHLVLARLPGAPEGTRGISLFIVPKFLPQAKGNEDYEPGERNTLICGSIEHKMGIKASSTCVMNFDKATGWLVGEPHQGMRAMFVMMNAARLAVGMQGLGLAEIAYQNAVAYARERLQGRALEGIKYPDKPADPIIVHPDVRKNLLTMKSFIEGARALAYFTGMQIDFASKHPDAEKRQEAQDWVELLTPVIKSYFTDMGFECTNLAVQIFGGHGYIAEWGVEQYVRDARIAQIYEGTNGIQALDLVGRKLPMHMGRLLRRFFHPLLAELESLRTDADLAPFLMPLMKSTGHLQQATLQTLMRAHKNPLEAGAAASDYLRIFALVALGWMWLKMAHSAQKALARNPDDADFYHHKLHTAQFFFSRVLPQTSAYFTALRAGADSLMALPEDGF